MADQSAQSLTSRSVMAVLLGGYFMGVMHRKETREHFKIKKIEDGPPVPADDGVPESFIVEFESGARVRVRVDDAPCT